MKEQDMSSIRPQVRDQHRDRITYSRLFCTSSLSTTNCRYRHCAAAKTRGRKSTLRLSQTQCPETQSRVVVCNSVRRVSSTQLRQQLSLLWFVFLSLLSLLTHVSPVVTQQELSITTTLPPPTPAPFNPVECGRAFGGNTYLTIYICIQHPDLFPILKYAERLAQEECEQSFGRELWNCSSFSLLKEPSVTSGDDFLQESAYVHALTVSVISHTVAKACTQNLLHSCSCDDDQAALPTEDDSVTYVQGCSDNLDYGLHVAETFLNKRYTGIGRGLKQELIHHNIKAAQLLMREVVDNTPVTCKCHGISGSCTFQSCYSELPEFSVIGTKLKEQYSQACKVASNGRTNHAWISRCDRDFGEKDFIFKDTYNWCIPNPSVGATGVVGRECDPNSSAPNSCENICRQCHRGVERREEKVIKDCKCSFRFCCEIECSKCEMERVYYVCS